MTDASCVGMMEGAFFVSRGEILQWLADEFDLHPPKIEDCSNGAVYLQIVDALFPKVPMSKVNWMAKYDWEATRNYKILQQVFDDNAIKKPIEVSKLTKGRTLDNLEFIQWMKALYDRTRSGDSYKAYERRQLANALPDWAIPRGSRGEKENSTARNTSNGLDKAAPRMAKRTDSGGGKNSEVNKLKADLSALRKELEAIERERDFYFNKLREIEILTQDEKRESLSIKEVQEILYAEDPEDDKVDK